MQSLQTIQLIQLWGGMAELKERGAEGGLGLSTLASLTSTNSIVWRMIAFSAALLLLSPLALSASFGLFVWSRPNPRKDGVFARHDAHEEGGEGAGKT